jgi:ribosomal protein L29
MNYKELSSLDKATLEKKEKESRIELMKLHAQAATGTAPKSPGQIRILKKTLAKITMIQEQQKEEQEKDA